ncbi:MAG: XTP/dITP diphosphatase [Oscillospiraceae bacterium]|nr:XTP/dITP diphosphatase [Oscillospiraceae bacterium]
MRFVLASNNARKLEELRQILSQMGHEVLSQRGAGLNLTVEETGTTFEENARLKARGASDALGLPVIADDSGLMVDALDGAPGVYSARYGGEGLDDRGRNALLLKNMEGKENRSARFVCCICCRFPDGREITARGECPGQILEGPRGKDGFGYDPVFYMPEYGKTMAEMTPEEKNAVSHRGRALEHLAAELRKIQK